MQNSQVSLESAVNLSKLMQILSLVQTSLKTGVAFLQHIGSLLLAPKYPSALSVLATEQILSSKHPESTVLTVVSETQAWELTKAQQITAWFHHLQNETDTPQTAVP